MYPRLFQIGHIIIPTYGAFIAVALVAALASLPPLARRLRLDAGKLWNLGLIGILTALISARLLLVVAYFRDFRQHPFWILGLITIPNPIFVPIAVLLGLGAALLYALAEGFRLSRVLDCIAPPVTLALAIGSVGAFLGGADFGLPAGNAWSVTYIDPFAYLWYETPLAVRLYPVQIYEAIAFFAIFAVLLWRLPRRSHHGELFGLWLFLAGLTGFFLDFYRAGGRTDVLFHEAIYVTMVAVSAVFLLPRKSTQRPARNDSAGNYTVVDDPQHV